MNTEQHPLRERLPTDRHSVVHKFKINGHKAYMIVGFYPDKRPGELFIHCDCGGSTMNGLLSTISILTSIALQHGISIDYLLSKFEGMKFEPSGLTANPEMPEASSFPDYIFRWIYSCRCGVEAHDTARGKDSVPAHCLGDGGNCS